MYNSNNYCCYLSLNEPQGIDGLVYYRDIAVLYQKMRKTLGLHPWDNITLSFYNSNNILKYEYNKNEQNIIYNITGYIPKQLYNMPEKYLLMKTINDISLFIQ